MEDKVHPNWRALASVPFQRKVFVKAKQNDDEKVKVETERQNIFKGSEAKEFYQSVLSEPSEPLKKTIKKKSKKIEIKISTEKKILNVRETDLCRAAEMDDIEFMKEALENRPDLKNYQDHYGWSVLMIASKAGSKKVTQYLMDLKVETSLKDKSGLDCFKLAKNDEIKEILRPKILPKIKSEKKLAEPKDQQCDLCQIENLSKSDLKAHVSSTVHQFKFQSQSSGSQKVHYVIPEANRGFQMMLDSGWERNKGLGPHGKSGKLYPVKTALKRDRTGLGLDEEGAKKKVTHFEPFDQKSVENPKKNSERIERHTTLSKKLQSRKLHREKQKEVDFRREFM